MTWRDETWRTLAMLLVVLVVLMGVSGCECIPEEGAELCAANGLGCGKSTLLDRCGVLRQAECGACPDGLPCEANQCGCTQESNASLCVAADIACGEAMLTDRCRAKRLVDCGHCSDAACSAMTPEQLCSRNAFVCGTARFNDGCGVFRDVDCGHCAEGELCFGGVCEDHSVLCAGCPLVKSTGGAITDADDGAWIGDAAIKFFHWPPEAMVLPNRVWPLNYRATDPDGAVHSTAEPWRQTNYALHPGACHDGSSDASLQPAQWYRVRIDKPGFEPAIFYRYHGAFEQACVLKSCADDAAREGRCQVQNFELRPQGGAFPRYPDLMVDTRDLRDREWQCALLPEGHVHSRLIGLRIAAGTANAGTGGLHVRGVDDDAGQGAVYQRIEWSDGRFDERLLSGAAFEFHLGHDHVHFLNWLHMALVEPRADCALRGDRDPNCVRGDVNKVSFCLMDLAPFDEEIQVLFDGVHTYADPPTCDSMEQGLTQGWKDVYGSYLPGQVIVLGPPAVADNAGSHWLEVAVNADGVLIETDLTNNFARISIEAAPASSTLCSNPATTLDCTMASIDYATSEQRWQCPDYLGWAN
ncbi:MAG: hypothetical protein H0U74_14975 [Bradymonadaceae bacterium]|nr:hypothetical protein [Lujinxingiaceae bacterium]